jgi:hypothetical protein
MMIESLQSVVIMEDEGLYIVGQRAAVRLQAQQAANSHRSVALLL